MGILASGLVSYVGDALSKVENRPLMPTDGPSPADHTNIAKPFDDEE